MERVQGKERGVRADDKGRGWGEGVFRVDGHVERLVPGGRTHRLSVVAAGMLQVALEIAGEKEKTNAKARKLAELIRNALEGSEEAGLAELTGLAEELFRDAGVGFKRTSRQGQAYSIAEDAAQQFPHWDDMPWE